MKTNYHSSLLTLVIAFVLSCFAHQASGALDIFLKIEGPEIEGESTDATHTKEIEVLAWSWGASQSGSTHLGGGGGGGKANFQDISITKWLDKSSVTLLKVLTEGAHIDKATLTVRKPGGANVLVMVMENIIVSSLSTGGSGGEDRLTENVTLNFSKFTITYFPEDDSTDPTFKWDIAENETF